jgi:UDP-3-O-[3-hydroxymyristoyl] glucosamine N-acyltransferase
MNKFFKNSGPFLLEDLIKEFGLLPYLNGEPLSEVSGIYIEDIKILEDADEKSISFFSNKKYIAEFKKSKAKACITEEKFLKNAPIGMIILIAKNSYVTFAKISAKFYSTLPQPNGNISKNSSISPKAIIGENCEIMDFVVIEDGVKIGNNVKIYPNVYIGKNVEIADHCIIHHNVTIQYAIINKNCIIHPGVRIGQDGFGYAFENGQYIKVPQIGHVIIGNNVEIGANCTIDRGTIKNTIIGDMSKIDNLVQLGHNVEIGRGCIIVSQVGISGSTKIGNYVQIGGQAGIAGHLIIEDGVQIAAQSGIIKNIAAKEIVFGTPALPIKQYFRQIVTLKKLANQGTE